MLVTRTVSLGLFLIAAPQKTFDGDVMASIRGLLVMGSQGKGMIRLRNILAATGKLQRMTKGAGGFDNVNS